MGYRTKMCPICQSTNVHVTVQFCIDKSDDGYITVGVEGSGRMLHFCDPVFFAKCHNCGEHEQRSVSMFGVEFWSNVWSGYLPKKH